MDSEALEVSVRTRPGDILQIDPDYDWPGLGGCLVVVTEHAGWQVVGYLAGYAHYRAGPDYYVSIPWEHVRHTGGRVHWSYPPDGEVSPWITST